MALQLSTIKAIRTLDIDHNGKVTRQEILNADKNGDKQLSVEEAQLSNLAAQDVVEINRRLKGDIPVASTVLFGQAELRSQRVVANIVAYYDQIDTNSDGQLSRSEVGKAVGNPHFNGEAAAVVSTLYKGYSDWKAFSDDQGSLPRLPEHPWLNKIPLHGFDETGIGKADLERFIVLSRTDNQNEKVQNVLGRYSVMEFGSSAKQKLFPQGIDSIRPDNIAQGEIGDCYFLAAVAALANTPAGKHSIMKMIQENQDGTYTVTFPNSKPVTFTSPTDTERGMYSTTSPDGNWLEVLEKAYAIKTNRDGLTHKFTPSSNPYDAIGNGGLLSSGISTLTGKSVDTDVSLLTSDATMRSKLQAALKEGRIMSTAVLKSLNPWNEGRTDSGLPRAHAYSILGFDAKTDQITIRNPWGHTELQNKAGQPRDGKDDGVFTMSLAEFKSTFAYISYQSA